MSLNVIVLLADWIAANTSFVKGTDLYPHFRLQDAPDRCVLIRNASGGILYPSARTRIDFMLQVISRSDVWGTAHDDIYTIHDLFYESRKSHVLLPDAVTPELRIEVIIPVAAPAPIGEDENKRHEFSVNYRLNSYRIV